MAEPYAHAHASPRDTHARDAREEVGERGEWPLIWRYRKQLAPFVIAFGALGISTWGHLESRSQDWIPLFGFLVVIGFTWRMDRLIERVYAATVGTATVFWMQASWQLGVDEPKVLLAWTAILVPAAIIWIHHQQPRGRIEIVGGSSWPWYWQRWQFRRHAKQRLESLVEEWPWIAQRAGVPGVTARKAWADFDDPDYVLSVDLHGWAVPDLNASKTLPRIASGLRALLGRTIVSPDDYEHQARIVWPRDDPWVPVEDEVGEGQG